MDLQTAIRQLEALGSADHRAALARQGVKGETIGVSAANLAALRKRIKIDHDLARGLWLTRRHEARVLATMVADPQAMTEADLDEWVKAVDHAALAEAIARLAANAPSARRVLEKWIMRPEEFTIAAGWNVLARLAADVEVPEGYFGPFLQRIENQIHKAAPRGRHAMNAALIAIGSRGGVLAAKALAAAKRIGAVQVDHGEWGGKTPDAATAIARVVDVESAKPPIAGAKAGRGAG